MAVRSLVATLLLASSALAKTDLAGCTYTDVVVMPTDRPAYDAYSSRIWYVPGTGELCDLLDCGGGRAPPKTNVPGCPLYSGTATYSPSYLNLQTKAAAAAGEATATGSSGATVTGETQVTTKATSAPATTLETSVSETASETDSAAQTTAAPTTAAPVKSSASSSSTVTASQGLTTGTPGRGNGTVTGAHPTSTFTTNGAAPTAVAILGSCLIAGVAACVGML